MDSQKIINDENISRVEKILSEMKSGNEEHASQSLDELIRIRESILYQELGKLTRDLHDSLNGFQIDTRISDLAEQEIPDAKERLNHVIVMTEKAANTTFEAIEGSIPICDELTKKSTSLRTEWQRFTNKNLTIEDFRKLVKSVNEFLNELETKNNTIKENLNEVLMAQGFQDLTGQIIKRVITLVNEVEGKLVDIIKLAGANLSPQITADSEEKKNIKAEGPHIPDIDKGDFVSGQDEVDDLLSSLGF